MEPERARRCGGQQFQLAASARYEFPANIAGDEGIGYCGTCSNSQDRGRARAGYWDFELARKFGKAETHAALGGGSERIRVEAEEGGCLDQPGIRSKLDNHASMLHNIVNCQNLHSEKVVCFTTFA